MLEKLKSYWGYVVGGVVAAFGILLYILGLKQNRIVALTAKLADVDTKEKVAEVQKEIDKLKHDQTLNAEELTALSDMQRELKEKQKRIKDEERDRDAKAIEEYWNK